ncbi:uncharacterized protein [Fopius arisanus]|uniref:MenD_2 protein n=1 Tax=Fopius arisanus TaxID=64838 RepID=A0A0C9RD82_9HYME|nr:PREDICTED: uncharacterized protein LOC105266149 [Fopius arisanus]XP_011302392.1 PREDICTED: uncharacterized protein LOC105266149 [Fopius arisanus]
MNHVCGIGITLAARIIAALGLSISIFMINILVSEFFSSEGGHKFSEAIETWSLLGLHWTQFVRNYKIPKQEQIILICILGYSLLFLISSTLLALGTVHRKPKYTLPWLYLQMISIVDQTVALTLHLVCPDDNNEKFQWYIPVSSIHLLITIYFWMIVFTAREDWSISPHRHSDIVYYDTPEETPRDSNLPKTPSFVAQYFNNHDSELHIPPKYNVV